MRHIFECPMRWADLDMLGHVNNVTYLDYAREARADFLAGVLESGARESISVLRNEVSYVHPLVFRFRPVVVECWVTAIEADAVELSYEIFHRDENDARTVYVRARSRLGLRLSANDRVALETYLDGGAEAAAARPVQVDPDGFGFDLFVRHSDLDASGHATDVQYFEFLQESRIRMIADITRGRDLPPMSFVVAQTDVDYLAPVVRRPEPYRVVSEVSRVGRRSMSIDSEILDGERTVARARVTTVFFDLETQRSVEPHPALRERLLEVRA